MPNPPPPRLALAGLIALALVSSARAGPTTYQLTSGALTWAQAQAEAEALDGHLAVINSESEQAALFAQFGIPDSPHGNLGGVWLGLQSDAAGVYSWVNGDPLDYVNWGQDQPGPTDIDNSFAFMSVLDGKWFDDGDRLTPRNALFGIIEIPGDDPSGGGNNVDSPEPASLVTLAFGGLGLLGYGWGRRARKKGRA
jgi:hypothetical protein